MRPHAYLRGRLVELGIDFAYLGQLLKPGIAISCVSKRMNGHLPWKSSEMYQIMDIIREPPEKLHVVFPANGGVVATAKKRRTA